MQKVQLIICKKDIQSANFLYFTQLLKNKQTKSCFSDFGKNSLFYSFIARYVLGSIIFLVSVAVVPLYLIQDCVCAHVCVRERDCLPLYNVSHFQMGLTSFAGNKKKGRGGLKIQCVDFSYPFYLLHSESF